MSSFFIFNAWVYILFLEIPDSAAISPAIDANDPGPAGFTGSLVVAEFPSLESARSWAEADPYMESGAYESVEVKPFKLVLP